jgi:ADP-ribose pyrophosphatase
MLDQRDAVLRRATPAFTGRLIDLELHDVRLPNGAECRLEIVRHPGAAAIVPLFDDGRVILVHQFRYAAAASYLYEIPAGTLGAGEAPEACARRELEEETGYRAREMLPLISIWPTPGFCNERIHLFLARGLEEGRASLGHDEVLRAATFSFDEALAMIGRGEIEDAKTIAGLAAAAIKLRGRIESP